MSFKSADDLIRPCPIANCRCYVMPPILLPDKISSTLLAVDASVYISGVQGRDLHLSRQVAPSSPQPPPPPPTASFRMKCVLVLAALVAVSFAQHGHHDQLAQLINHEVHALVMADSGLTVDACTTKCDALFDLIASGDEATTDKMCAHACDWYGAGSNPLFIIIYLLNS
ncbi:hypothetical protein PoB_005313400 [Plakobranchus ocellatus]|uniref:Uncharacterized protein n=1 Tax=Plakobranchus ocellatus TaxID=259542 RepID=A0AAV4C276_9GAST|nr:hypothetical protein PoB_005313400 [Plakobranchus ocellatus]